MCPPGREGVLMSTQEQAGFTSGTASQGQYYSTKDLQSEEYIF